MKGQAEALNMTLFLLIAVVLLFSVFAWGSSVIGGNSDEARLFSAEQFMRTLDGKVTSVAKNGGSEILPMPPSANIRMAENNTVEYRFASGAYLPDTWVYVSGDDATQVGASGFASVIREEKEGSDIVLQLYYRNRTGAKTYVIQPFIYYGDTGRNIITVDSNGTSVFGNLVLNRVRLSIG